MTGSEVIAEPAPLIFVADFIVKVYDWNDKSSAGNCHTYSTIQFWLIFSGLMDSWSSIDEIAYSHLVDEC
jgi:hypothetical protein